MQPFQQRVVDEANELRKKSDALRAFLKTPVFSTLPEAEQGRMTKQLGFMDGYFNVLQERIAAFK